MFGECKDRGRVLRKGRRRIARKPKCFPDATTSAPPRRAARPLRPVGARRDEDGRHHGRRIHAEEPNGRLRRHGDVDEQGHGQPPGARRPRGVPHLPVLGANQSYSHTFTKSGNFDYRDAFNTNRRGSITVRAGVTLKASAPLVAYGGSVTLSGVTSSGAAGETVTLDAMECGKTTFARVASVRSVAQGAWSLAVKPTMNTVYRSNWKNATSAQLAGRSHRRSRSSDSGSAAFAALRPRSRSPGSTSSSSATSARGELGRPSSASPSGQRGPAPRRR